MAPDLTQLQLVIILSPTPTLPAHSRLHDVNKRRQTVWRRTKTNFNLLLFFIFVVFT